MADTSAETLGYIVLSKGAISPFAPVGAGEMALCLTVFNGVLTLILQMPAIEQEDRNYFGGNVHGIGWLPTPANPVGALTILMVENANSQAVWPLYAPLLAHPEDWLIWLDSEESGNSLVTVLVESNSNLVEAIRVRALPSELVDELRSRARVYALQQRTTLIAEEFLHYTSERIWQDGRKWVADDDGEFVEQRR